MNAIHEGMIETTQPSDLYPAFEAEAGRFRYVARITEYHADDPDPWEVEVWFEEQGGDHRELHEELGIAAPRFRDPIDAEGYLCEFADEWEERWLEAHVETKVA